MAGNKRKAIEADINRVSQDVSQLGQDVREQAEFIAEEVGAAEFVAASGMAESLGIALTAAEQFAEIAREQVEFGQQDMQALLEELAGGPSPAVVMNHLARRNAHLWTGFVKTQSAIVDEQLRLLGTGSDIWKVFFDAIDVVTPGRAASRPGGPPR